MNTHRLLTSLNLSEIDRVQLGFFRQLLLAYLRRTTMSADGRADEFSMP